ncbi:MAG: TorF family putative porin [Hyphomonadaceae bacterium]
MKKIIGLAMLAGAATVATAGVASAEGTVSANVALTSNYVWRGLTQSDGDAAIQGGFDYTADMFYAGVWGSSVDDFGVDAQTEVDLYAGITPTVGPVTFDLGLVGYFYPGASDSIDFGEVKLGATYAPIEPLSLGATAYLSNDFGNAGIDSLYLEVNGAYTISDAFSVSAAYGNQDLDSAGEYDTWNIGATYSFHGFGFDLRYHDTDITGLDEEISFTISREL